MKKKRTIVAVLAMVLTLGAGLAGCSTKSREIAFADVGWDSVKFHNAVALRIWERTLVTTSRDFTFRDT